MTIFIVLIDDLNLSKNFFFCLFFLTVSIPFYILTLIIEQNANHLITISIINKEKWVVQ